MMADSLTVLVAPDKFAGTLTARQAATAIARGWASARPDDSVDSLPLSDGGPGFLSALHPVVGGTIRDHEVPGPTGQPVVAQILTNDTANNRTCYLESAQACGLHLLSPQERDPTRTSSAGLGHLVRACRAQGPDRIVIGLGGTGTNDGGAGMLATLGAEPSVELNGGGAALAALAAVAPPPGDARAAGGTQIVAACDVLVPLLGRHGASLGFSRQKGADEDDSQRLEQAMEHWLAVTGGEDRPGCGAAGGLGYGLSLLGADLVAGAHLVLTAVHMAERLDSCDILITGEGRVDWQTTRGKLVGRVVEQATGAGVPCLVLAGELSPDVTLPGATCLGLIDEVGRSRALHGAAGALEAVAARAAERWNAPGSSRSRARA